MFNFNEMSILLLSRIADDNDDKQQQLMIGATDDDNNVFIDKNDDNNNNNRSIEVNDNRFETIANFDAQHNGDLSFAKGELLTIVATRLIVILQLHNTIHLYK
jgi:hypothetical protein